MSAAPFVELKHISKYFAKVIANQDVSLQIRKGEVLALLGENGAGKSTIMKVLYGLYRADEGQILVDGQEQVIHSPKHAMRLGIAMIQQHFALVQAHTVTENIILGLVKGRYDLAHYDRIVAGLAAEHGFALDPTAVVGDLPVGVQQKVEILKALYQNAQLLIMDEPTAVLTPQESGVLMNFVRQNTRSGRAVVFITHKLREVMDVADRIVVMRNGRVVGDVRKEETDELDLSKLMVGRAIHDRTYVEDVVASQRPIGLELQTCACVTSASRCKRARSWALRASAATGRMPSATPSAVTAAFRQGAFCSTGRTSPPPACASGFNWASAMCLPTATATA